MIVLASIMMGFGLMLIIVFITYHLEKRAERRKLSDQSKDRTL